jgi:hypothetical protein
MSLIGLFHDNYCGVCRVSAVANSTATHVRPREGVGSCLYHPWRHMCCIVAQQPPLMNRQDVSYTCTGLITTWCSFLQAQHSNTLMIQTRLTRPLSVLSLEPAAETPAQCHCRTKLSKSRQNVFCSKTQPLSRHRGTPSVVRCPCLAVQRVQSNRIVGPASSMSAAKFESQRHPHLPSSPTWLSPSCPACLGVLHVCNTCWSVAAVALG